MIIIVCVDDANGMMFHNRRQSQDRVVREHILEEVGQSKLWMNAYTRKQFGEEISENIIVDEEFLDKAQIGEFCFVENLDLLPYVKKIEKIIIFKWNRRYPGDFFFREEILGEGWKLENTEEFAGFSHEKITKEVYKI